jgi:hypothetical protein
MTDAVATVETEKTRDIRKRWLLSLPALLIILAAASGPLLIVVAYSFLTPGPYGDVVWQPSLDGWINVFLEKDIFDDTLSLASAHISIFCVRSCFAGDNGADAGDRLSHGLFHRHAPGDDARTVAAADHHTVLDEPADPHLCHLEIIRNEGLINTCC